MSILLLVAQDAPTLSFIHYLLAVLLVIISGALSYYVSKFLTGRRYRREHKAERQKMFDIEKALKDFWEHERGKLSAENNKLTERAKMLEKQVEEYRKKAAGVGIMGLSKDARTDMLLQLMLENEALEEKLYEMNLKLKEERDEYLTKEIGNITYKRILLSEILKEKGIQDKIRDILKDDSRLRKLKLPSAPGPLPPAKDEPAEEEAEEEEQEEEK
jgi:hypothetical protein